jgi:PAS domain S-box-containing protein
MQWRVDSIRTKFVLGTIGIVMILGLAMVLFVKIVLYKKLYDNLERRGMFIAHQIAVDSVSPVLTEKFFEVQMAIKDLKKTEEDIEYIFVQSASGDVVAHTFEKGFPKDLENIDGKTAPNGINRFEAEKGGVIDFHVPLLNGTIGHVHVGMLEAPIRRSVNQTIMLFIGIIVVVMAVGVGIAVAFATAITRPIQTLAAASRAVEGGNLDVQLSIQSDDEIGRLGRTFNSMIEARKKSEEELQKSEQMLRDVTSNLGEGVLVMNDQGMLSFMNPEAERLLGWSEAELKGKDIHELTHYRKVDNSFFLREECPNVGVLATGERVTIDDDVFMRKDGTAMPVAYISAPIVEGERVVAVVVAFRDITARRLREAERERLITELQDALDKVKTLKGMIPICSSCKKIRDDTGYWSQIEAYIRDHSDAEFSHGICPDCAKRLYPDFYKDEP